MTKSWLKNILFKPAWFFKIQCFKHVALTSRFVQKSDFISELILYSIFSDEEEKWLSVKFCEIKKVWQICVWKQWYCI